MDNKINFGFHAELENIKSAGEKDEKKIHHSGKQPPRSGLAEQVYPVHGTNENQLVCSHFLEPNYRHEINHRNPPIIIRSSKHLPTDVRREANIGQRRLTQMISLKLLSLRYMTSTVK